MKRIVIIDGQGGKMGKRLIEELLAIAPDADITAIGTNSTATSTMLKGGAARGASGTNAIKVACRTADIISGPIGIIVADALLGEITPEAAEAIGASNAVKVLVPVSKCGINIAGLEKKTATELIKDAAELIKHELVLDKSL